MENMSGGLKSIDRGLRRPLRRQSRRSLPLSLALLAIFSCLLLVFFTASIARADISSSEMPEDSPSSPSETSKAQKKIKLIDLPKAYKEGSMSFFPIPVFETDPSAGKRYGIMPTFVIKNKEDEVISIFVAAFTYNSVVKFGGYGGAFLYPSVDERLRLFIRQSQNFEKDYYLQYTRNIGFDDKVHFETELEYTENPFERFFGLGPSSPQSDQSNFVSKYWFLKGRVGYELIPHFEIRLRETFTRLRMGPKALGSLLDANTFFAGLPEVGDFTQWLHRLAVSWDTRDSDQFSSTGHYLEAYFLAAHRVFDTHRFYDGYGFTARQYWPEGERFKTVATFKVDQVFGNNIPFYLQPALGGDSDLRAFVERRFVGRGRTFLDVEERILIKRFNVLGTTLDFSADPFFSVGQVFNNWSQFSVDNLQPVGGLGFRGLAPPSVVGRVDFGYGKEGLQIYMTLDYPF